ncbi:MAG: AgmX/PglI C-terminal domain-containing protein [Pseudomonadota bacterium]
MQSESEIGGLDAEAVDKVFARSLGALQECLEKGAERLELLGGSVGFFLKIDSDGRIAHAHLERSTLGDRDTERCMLSALRAKTWPKPIGGSTGLARKAFEFDPPKDVRPPTDWDPAEVQETVGKLEKALAECKGSGSGTFEATAYVDTDGSVLAAGVTPPDEAGEASVDCLVGVIKEAKFPSPGSWPAKVTFSL